MADVLDTSEVQGQRCDLQNESAAEAGATEDLNSSDVTADILQQALNEASATQISEQLDQHDVAAEEQQLLHQSHNGESQGLSSADNAGVHAMQAHDDDGSVTGARSLLVSESSSSPQPITVNTLSGSGSAPLGSKTNPIRIVQQGSTYTSTQHLTQEQIAQIVQVLQRQNIAARTVDGQPTAVFNPQTKTRIVYRVVQPHSNAGNNTTTNEAQSGQLTARAYHEAKYGSLEKKKRGPGRPRFVAQDSLSTFVSNEHHIIMSVSNENGLFIISNAV